MVGHMYGCNIRPSATPQEKSKMVVGEFLPDLYPMDYFEWGAVEKDAISRASTTKSQLVDRITAVLERLPRESVTSACSRFRCRTEAVIDANGGYLE